MNIDIALINQWLEVLKPILLIAGGISSFLVITHVMIHTLARLFTELEVTVGPKEHDERKAHDHDYPEYSADELGLDWADEPDGELILLDDYEEYQQR